MKLRHLIILSTIFLLFYSFNAVSEDTQLLALKNNIESNYYSFDIKKLKKLLYQAESNIKSNPNEWHYFYYAGLLDYNLGKIYYQIDKDIAFNYFEKSVDYFDKASSNNRSVEMLSLLSAGYGKLSSLSKLSSIYYGIKAKLYIEEAYAKERDNPKLLLIAATHLMHTPESFGGSKTKAGELLRLCLELNKNPKTTDSYEIKWADNPEIYAYLAQLEVLNGNKTKAKQYIDKALKLIPDYGFVLKDLIPQLNQLK